MSFSCDRKCELCDGFIPSEKNSDMVKRCPEYLIMIRKKKIAEKFPELRGDIASITAEFQEKNKAMVAMDNWLLSGSRHLFVCGPDFGTGKTHIAANVLIRYERKIDFFSSVEFFKALSETYSADRKIEPTINFQELYRSKYCILIDDVCKENRTPANVSQFQIFLSAFPGKIIFTSNFPPDKWNFPDAIQSRLRLVDRVVVNILNAKNMREKEKIAS